jgi:hypothetical protein
MLLDDALEAFDKQNQTNSGDVSQHIFWARNRESSIFLCGSTSGRLRIAVDTCYDISAIFVRLTMDGCTKKALDVI